MLGASTAVIATALVLVAIGGAVTGVGRAQRAADLSAVSAARSMRDDVPRLLAPARLPGGAPNPTHLSKHAFLARATMAAREVASPKRRRAGARGGDLPRHRRAGPDPRAGPGQG